MHIGMYDIVRAWSPRLWPAALACAVLSGCGDAQPEPAAAVGRGGPLVIATTSNAPPFVCRSETGEFCGMDVEIARAAAAKLGRQLVVKVVDYDELLPSVKSGEADMAGSGLSISKSRMRSVDFSAPYAVDGGAFIYRAGEPMPTMIRAESLRVATVDSMLHDFYLTRHGIDPIRYRSFDAAFADLGAGRVDAVFYDRLLLVVMAERSGGRFAVSKPIGRDFCGIALGKGRPELKAALDAVIREREARR